MKSSRLLWAIAAAGLAVWLVGCGKPAAPPVAAMPIAVTLAASDVVAAAPGWVDVQGGTRHLSARADGIVAATLSSSDAVVPAGSVLLRLDNRELQLDLQANALESQRQQQTLQALRQQLQLAQQEVSRLQELVDMQAEAADVLRQAQAQAQSLSNQLKAATLAASASQLQRQRLNQQLDQLLVRAPSAGRVLRLDVHAGESVTRGNPVVWFAPEAPLTVRAELDERLLSRVQVGMHAEVESESGDGVIHQAKLIAIARSVGPVRALPEIRPAAKDDHVVECIFTLTDTTLLIGQRVTVRIRQP